MRRIFFLTSSRAKMAHARHLARRFHLEVEPQRNYGVTYVEPRIANREELLRRSFEDAKSRWSKTISEERNLFFIEDTSVVIHALSTPEHEFPGLDVKYWMRETKFEDVDSLIEAAGGDRSVTVRSDVVLYLPPDMRRLIGGGKDHIIFTGETHGSLTEREISIRTNPIYPWLDSGSFNKWFIPIGASQPLSSLPIETADLYDIRKKSIGAALGFLQSHGLIDPLSEATSKAVAVSLPLDWPPLFVVSGLPCSGKTTIGSFLVNRCGFHHIEASDFMRVAYLERLALDSGFTLDEFAAKALADRPDIVASQVLEELADLDDHPAVITGFRSPAETEHLISRYSGRLRITPVLLDADLQLRFERCLLRDRDDAPRSLEEFQNRDDVQGKMGLTEMAHSQQYTIIRNNDTIDSFTNEFATLWKVIPAPLPKLGMPSLAARLRLEERVLIALALHEQSRPYLTSTEIARRTNLFFGDDRTNKNNVSRYLNQKARPYFRFTDHSGKRLFTLSQTGYSKALLVLRQKATELRIRERSD